jgi:hypothetical protein
MMANPVFQAKVKIQRAKVAAQETAEEVAAAAKKNETKRKPCAVTTVKKKEDDNIANVATNKGNLHFYARTKVLKDALDAVHLDVHGLMGEWFVLRSTRWKFFALSKGNHPWIHGKTVTRW